jgi:hypothetical protein
MDAMKSTVLDNGLDGRRMLELARTKEGPLQLAQMYRGYEALSGAGKFKMLVTCGITLSLFLDEHTQQQANEPAATGTKRKAEDPPQDDLPEPEPELPADDRSPCSVAEL